MNKKVLIIGGIAVLVLGTVGIIWYSSSKKKLTAAKKAELEARLTAQQRAQYQQLPASQKEGWLQKTLGILTTVGELGKTGTQIYSQYQQSQNAQATPPTNVEDQITKMGQKSSPVALNSQYTGTK